MFTDKVINVINDVNDEGVVVFHAFLAVGFITVVVLYEASRFILVFT